MWFDNNNRIHPISFLPKPTLKIVFPVFHSAHPQLVAKLLQILIAYTFCQKDDFHIWQLFEDGLLGKNGHSPQTFLMEKFFI